MTNIIHLASSRSEPAKRACGTCRHAPNEEFDVMSRCRATGRFLTDERGGMWGTGGICGVQGSLWEPIGDIILVKPSNRRVAYD